MGVWSESIATTRGTFLFRTKSRLVSFISMRRAPNWLRAPDGRTRDYYRVEDKHGRRFWLYSEGPRDGMTPQWYLHGLFP